MKSTLACLVALFFTLGSMGVAVAQSSAESNSGASAAILTPVQVVQSQLEAFATGDWDTAYSFAAPSIKAAFPSPQIFEAMVNHGYSYMLEPLDAAVSLVDQDERQAIVEAVFVSDKTDVTLHDSHRIWCICCFPKGSPAF